MELSLYLFLHIFLELPLLLFSLTSEIRRLVSISIYQTLVIPDIDGGLIWSQLFRRCHRPLGLGFGFVLSLGPGGSLALPWVLIGASWSWLLLAAEYIMPSQPIQALRAVKLLSTEYHVQKLLI